MRIRWSALALALCFCASSARADYLDWSYSWSMIPPSIVSKTGFSGVVGTTAFGTGTADPVEAVTLNTFSSSSATTEDDITIPSSDYTLTVTLQDTGNPALLPQVLTFTGKMWGTVSPATVDVQNNFDSTFDSVVIGEYLYKVNLTSFKSPTVDSLGSITAQISVEQNVQVTRTPEPSSLLLAGLVVPALVWYRSRRKGKASAEPIAA